MTTVVIVDDVPEVRALVRAWLRRRGHYTVVGEAATAAEALEQASALQPDVVVLDLGLPDASGGEVLTRLRSVVPGAAVVIFTGPSDPESARLADMAAGFVHKDRPQELIDALERATMTSNRLSFDVRLPAGPASARMAREHVRHQLRSWGLEQLAEDACMVASELVTNAIEHARCEFTLRLQASRDHPERVRVEVTDTGGGTPAPQTPSVTAEGGRGLLIVSALAAAWGIETRDARAKVVWAEVSDPGASAGPWP